MTVFRLTTATLLRETRLILVLGALTATAAANDVALILGTSFPFGAVMEGLD